MTTEIQEANIATLPPADRALIVLNSTKTEASLRDLVEKSTHITAVIDPAGREQAHRAGMNLKNARIAIEKTGKAAREDAAAFQSAVIAEQKRLIAVTEAEEKRIFGLRDDFDAKLAAEKAEKERIERQRVAAIKGKIDGIRNLPFESREDNAAQIALTIGDLDGYQIQESVFQEFTQAAIDAKNGALEGLDKLRQAAQAREDEAARLAAERAELERQRREQEEREAQERAAREEEARKLAEERAEFERKKAEFEAQQRAAAEEAQRKADAEAQALVAQADVTTVVVAVAEEQRSMVVEPSGSTCQTCNDNGMIGGPSYYAPDEGGVSCPDCQQYDAQRAVDYAEAPAPQPAPGSYAACPRHNWLLEEGQDGTQPCPECTSEAETACVLAGPARTYTADDIRAAFIAGWECTSTDLARAASAYVASLEG